MFVCKDTCVVVHYGNICSEASHTRNSVKAHRIAVTETVRQTAWAADRPGCLVAAGALRPLGPWGSGCMFSSMITTSWSSSDRSTASAAVAPALLLSSPARLDGTAAVATLASLLLGPSALSTGPLHEKQRAGSGSSQCNGLVLLDALCNYKDQPTMLPFPRVVAGRQDRLHALYATCRLQAKMQQTVCSTLLYQQRFLLMLLVSF